MKKIVLLISLFLMSSAGATDQSVIPLYETNSFTPGAYIPFKVVSTGTNVKIIKANILPKNENCGLILDPYRENFFLLKCNAEASRLTLELVTVQDGVGKILKYGTVDVKVPFDDVKVIIPEDPGVDPDINFGKSLFSVNCANCHTPSSKKHASVSSLKATLVFSTGQPQMNGKNSTSPGCTDGNPATVCPPGVDLRSLSDADISRIVKYLGSLK